MKLKKPVAVRLLAAAVFALLNSAYADDKDKLIPPKLLTTIAPGGLTGFDISWVDSEAGRYYDGPVTSGEPETDAAHQDLSPLR